MKDYLGSFIQQQSYKWTDEFVNLKNRLEQELRVLDLVLRLETATRSQDSITMAVSAFEATEIFRSIKKEEEL